MKHAILKSDLFTTTIFKRTFGFMLLSSLGAALADIADALVLGVRLGEPGLAAISFVLPIYMYYNVLSLGLASGGAICYAKLLGAGKAREAVTHFNELLWLSIGMGALTAGLGVAFLPQIIAVLGVTPGAGAVYGMTWQYAEILLLGGPIFFSHSLFLAFVRNDDGAKTASIAFITGSAVDICLNFVFVFGLDMGVAGAALATVLGELVGIGVCVWYVLRPHTILKFSRFQFHWRNIISSFGTGLSTSTQSAWSFAFFIIINNLFMRLGGTSAVAVFDVTLNVSFLTLAPFTATGQTLQPMVSTFVGERNVKAIKSTLRLSLGWGMLFGLVGIAVLWVFSAPLCTLFGLSAEVAAQYGVFAIRCYLVSAVASGASIIYMDYFQAVSREKTAFFISFLRGFALFIPAAFLCAHLFGIQGVWFMFLVTESLTLAFTLILTIWRRKHGIVQQVVPTKTWLLDTGKHGLSELLSEAEEFADTLGATPKQSMIVVMMIEEICSAIFQEGLAGDRTCIQITLLCINNDNFELHIRDNAYSFNLFSTETQRLTSVEDVTDDTLKSLPLLLIRKHTKSHFYRHYQGFNTLSLTIGE